MFGDPVEQYSPSKRYRLTFHNFEEPRMCYSTCKFYLTDLQIYETIDFEPLWAIGIGQTGFSWSENEKFLSIPIAGHLTESFFVYNIESKQFSFVNFNNCWILRGYCHNDYIEVEYDEKFESDHTKYPTKAFAKPENLLFNFSDLEWIDLIHIADSDNLRKKAKVIEFKPIDLGWRLFKGQLPRTTEILVWELEKFAQYGELQSQKWFSEIEAKTLHIDYWVNASHYLGIKYRQENIHK